MIKLRLLGELKGILELLTEPKTHFSVDGYLAPPDLGVIDDVVMEQGAGVDHLTDAGHSPLKVTDPGRGHAQV